MALVISVLAILVAWEIEAKVVWIRRRTGSEMG
jgi:hypothetical protein